MGFDRKGDALYHLASIISPWWADPSEALLIMLSFPFDAGGDEGTRVVTVAGFGSSEGDWREFSRLWTSRLAKDDIAFFRAVDAASFRGPFKHWRNRPDRGKLRDKLFADLMDILKRHVYRKFGCAVVNAEFNKMSKSLRDEFAITAYVLGGRTVERRVREWIKAEWTRNTPFALVFEDGDKGKGKLMQRLEEDGCSLPNFRPKKDKTLKDGTVIHGYIPLQAADWLAYEVSLATQQMDDGKISGTPDFRWPMREFASIPGPLGTYDAEDIRKLERGIGLIKELAFWETSAGIGKRSRRPRKRRP